MALPKCSIKPSQSKKPRIKNHLICRRLKQLISDPYDVHNSNNSQEIDDIQRLYVASVWSHQITVYSLSMN